ncbi:cupin domain-containing protein [Planosporangium flavigriseum]|uniref:Cupin n=1 Tax=Planosporangium flavigriseum TaxID=373681 RepID=A0A8J3LR23_9ACTN|nr:cupin domain-containing protein [Planosporangium flavigriseum]NJC67896.1 cupin domain-containing protein [Planosporangium flavigriseum]GIG76447.1 cupin [Planosporangium flavigriseum]
MDFDDAAPLGGESSPEESLGARIREFREARRMSLRALAAQAQTSPGFLSQLERGQVNASIGTLRKLAGGLGMTLPDLFTPEDANRPKVLRRAERPVIHASNLTSKYLLSQKPLRNLEVYAGELLPGGDASEAFTHGDAQEMIVVVSGCATLELAGAEYPLDVGDSAEYRTSTPHTVRNRSAYPTEVLWIVSPPTAGAT